MAYSIFRGKNEAWLLAKKEELLTAYTETIASGGSADSSFTGAKPEHILNLMQQVDLELNCVNPDDYPAPNLPVTRTKAIFP